MVKCIELGDIPSSYILLKFEKKAECVQERVGQETHVPATLNSK